jgi:hypothetical protein
MASTEKPPARPGAAAMATDDESGTQGMDDDGRDERRRALYALETMFKRGLIPEAEFKRRRAALEGGA